MITCFLTASLSVCCRGVGLQELAWVVRACVSVYLTVSVRRGQVHCSHPLDPVSEVQTVTSACGHVGSFSVEHALLDEKIDASQNGRGYVPTTHSTGHW